LAEAPESTTEMQTRPCGLSSSAAIKLTAQKMAATPEIE
jgi:hypothetical protein